MTTSAYLLFFISLFAISSAAKILLVAFAFHSHVSEISQIGEALATQGHEVYILLPEKYQVMDWLNKLPIKRITFKHIYEDTWSQPSLLDDIFQKTIRVTLKEEFRMNLQGYIGLCDNMLSDTDSHERLLKMKFDLAIVDGIQLNRCSYVLPYILDIPHITLYTIYEPWLSRNPSLPSVQPFVMSPLYSEKMTFWERLTNLLTMIEYTYIPNVATMDERFVKEYAKNKPYVTINNLAGKSLLWLLDNDMLLDYPRPLMPNEVMIGGLTTKPAKPLSGDLDRFMSSASHGVIVVSFGSTEGILPVSAQEKLFNVFARLQQKIIWRLSQSIRKENEVPDNVLVLKWLPQNDLLGHNNTKLFITHCGANGQFEAMYHAVPMVGIPMFGEQPYNSKRLDYHKFGKGLPRILDFTEEQLFNAIHDVLEKPLYKENIQKASSIFRSQPDHPKQRAVYWVEHVLKYGGQHLRSHALDMPWYQYLMLDIAAFVTAVFLSFIAVVILFCMLFNKKKSLKIKHE